jgi:hypothetical protein
MVVPQREPCDEIAGVVQKLAEDLHGIGFDNPAGRDHADIAKVIAGKSMEEIAAPKSPAMAAMKAINSRRERAALEAHSRNFPDMCKAFLNASPHRAPDPDGATAWDFPKPW